MNVVNLSLSLPTPRLIMRMAHEIDGSLVPGNRGLHDNPDTYYRIIPVDWSADFVPEGQTREHLPTIFEITLLSRQWETIDHLSKDEIICSETGRFRLHIGYEPAAEACQFIQNTAYAEVLLIRETLADWNCEQPCTLEVQSVGDSNRVDKSYTAYRHDIVKAAADRVHRWFQQAIAQNSTPLNLPANTFPKPKISGELGKLVTQPANPPGLHSILGSVEGVIGLRARLYKRQEKGGRSLIGGRLWANMYRSVPNSPRFSIFQTFAVQGHFWRCLDEDRIPADGARVHRGPHPLLENLARE